ncbi:N-acetylglucosamine-6-phosphate deacetylase [Limihaloglobus sulfuriphilus]|uniref:N-acetylglucosamine-6-phosphate deacetylase n=1 Tax=Limihaloglobus sulfuriphilus TaxID=1851148 RepID=A0A1Q2MI40_9BACT|nr:N-acetylglucosamine-6-phosphate deacetylase [Limihaloglobus sulfuriphilus]AQQ72375.1 N-acetylglucosamine-6-phosphate deacetylase [Limihaloglobus sulfuriphilus]
MHTKIKYCDLQVNGSVGVDFSSPDLTDASFIKAVDHLTKSGTDCFLPTLITSPLEIYEKNLKIIANAVASSIGKHIPGVHIEGPFISDKPGSVGAHNPQWVQKPDIRLLEKLMEFSDGKVKLITIAAEAPGAENFCKEAVKMGITVSLGHQAASSEQLKRMAQAGATLLTHLGNGTPNVAGRHDNPILKALAVKELAAMIITDGFHLPPHVIEAIINAKGVDKVIVTSDASPIAGLAPGRYDCLGNDAVLEPSGLLHNPEKECLVGSSFNIAQCADYLRKLKILSEEEIVKVTSENPRKFISLS